MKKITALFLLMQMFIPAQAAGIETSLSYGAAAFHGDLTSDQSAPVKTAQIRAFDEPAGSMFGFTLEPFLGFEVLHVRTTATATRFPYLNGTKLNLLGFFMTPGYCARLQDSLALCAAVGIGTLNVNSQTDRQDYGTWNYELATQYLLGERGFVKVVGKKVGDVEQMVGEQSAHFWLTSVALAFGINLNHR